MCCCGLYEHRKASGRLRNTFVADRENLLRRLFNKPVSILDLQLMHKTYLYIMIISLYPDDVIGLFLGNDMLF